MHIAYVSMALFESLAQFPVGHLPHQVMPTLVLLLCQIIIIIIICHRGQILILHSCQWITFATELCQLLYSFSAKLLLLLFSPCGFSTSELADDLSLVCEWHDSKSPRVSRTLLAAYNNAVVWMVSTRPPTSKSTSPFNNTGQQFFLIFNI